jgi:hypothetical protein
MESVKQAHGQLHCSPFLLTGELYTSNFKSYSCNGIDLLFTVCLMKLSTDQTTYGRMVRQLLQDKLERICK